MARFALIIDGRVHEVIEVPSIEGRYHPSLLWVPCGAEVQQGWLYANGQFQPPEGA